MILIQKPIDKALLLGDIHYGLRNNSMEMLHNIDNIFFRQFLIPYILSIPDIHRYQLFFTGDILDSKQMYSIVVQNHIQFTFERLASILPVHINLGNHDLYGNSSVDIGGEQKWIHACRFLSNIPNVQVYDEPTTLKTITGRDFTIIPFIGTPNKHDLSKEIEIVENIPHNDYLFMHTTVEGFFYEGKPIVEGEGITKKLLSRFKKVHNGHIHSMQEDGNVLILGTPYHTKQSESDNPCYIYDVDYSGEDEVVKMIENELSPRYRVLNILRLMGMTVDKAIKYVRNNYVKVKVPSHLTMLYDYNSIRDILAPHARTIEFDPMLATDDTKETTVGEEGIDMTKTGKVDIKGKYPGYLDKLSIALLSQKDSVEVTDEMKIKLQEDFDKLYAKAEEKIGVNDIEM